VLAAWSTPASSSTPSTWNKFADEINDLISDYEQQIYGHADQEFNIASPTQLADILFDKLKLPTKGIKKGKTGYSTAASELDKLRGEHPIIDVITQYREVAKLKNTYVDTLAAAWSTSTRACTLPSDLTNSQTGRLNSTDPNLQNIPIRTDLGRRIRTAFVAGKGKQAGQRRLLAVRAAAGRRAGRR
jgi:DNA polymerase-1